MSQEQINKRVEDALNSIEGIQSATLSPFFKTRIWAAISNREETENTWQVKPVLLIAVSVCLIIMNAILFTNLSYNNSTEKNIDQSSIAQFSKEYNLNTYTNNLYDIEQ